LYKKISAIIALMILFVLHSAVYAQAPVSPANQQAAQEMFNNLTPAQKQALMQQQSKQDNLTPAQRQALLKQQADQTGLTPGQQQVEKIELTPEQLRVIQHVLSKTRGLLTPQAIEVLRQSPEFREFKWEDFAKSKDLIEKSFIPQELPEPKPSFFEKSRMVGKYQDIDLQLLPFGYEFFKDAAVGVVTERKDVPVPATYVVGPGDEVKIMLWGRVNAQYNLTIDRNGSINIPSIGPLYVAGMTFEKMSTYLIQQATQIVGANIDVSMGALKTIPVFILGDVKRPGAYTIGSFSTITDALLMAGGPTEIGSMRNVQLRRKDRIVTTFDLYSLLLRGDKSADAVLRAGDVVFVPVSGPLVGIAGNVKRPAIYELKENHNLHNALELAGGILPSAYTQQIQISRIQKNQREVVVDIDDRHMQKAEAFHLQDADLVKIFTIVDKDQNSVYLEGNVKKPGRYEFRKGMKISDLIKDNADLLDETYYDYALVKRLILPQRSTQLVPFNLGKIILNHDKQENLELHPEDRVYIYSKWLFKEKPHVTIEGEIRGLCSSSFEDVYNEPERDSSTFKGSYGKSDRGSAGFKSPYGKSESGSSSFKYSNDQSDIMAYLEAIDEELKEDYEGNKELLFKIKSINDELKKGENAPIRDIMEIRDEAKRKGNLSLVENLDAILKKIKKSCKLELADGMTVRDAILNSGGLTNNYFMDRAEIIRVNEKKAYTTLYFNVAKAMSGDAAENLALQHKDTIVIHSIYEYEPQRIVYVDGEISRPGIYQYTINMTVRDLVFKAGLLESAYLNEAEVSSQVVLGGKIVQTEYRKLNLKEALQGNPAHNVVLRPHDRLMIKRITNWRETRIVEVAGEVNYEGKYVIKKGDKLSSLIERAGGYTEEAYLRGAVFTREKVREMQQKSIEEMADRLEKELLSATAVAASTALNAEEVVAKKAEMEQKKALIENMRKAKALGRMTIRLAHLRLLKGSEYDFELEDGDKLYIPELSSTVGVVGAVMSQGAHVFSSKADYQDYIDMCGGYSSYADKSKVFILKVDGSARKAHRGVINWNEKNDRMEMAAFSEADTYHVEPGDVIAVPEDFARVAWLREIRDITQILMNTAVASGNLVLLFRSF